MNKVLLISGSQRKGNTEYILIKIREEHGIEGEPLLLRKKNIKHCVGCLSCDKTHKCILEDDMKEILDQVKKAELLIIGGPNYFDNVSGLMKDFIDRLHPCYKSENLKNKKLILVNVGGGESAGTDKYMNLALYGMIKYLKMNKLGSFSFKALEAGSIEKIEIENEIEKIKSLIDKNVI